MMEQTIGVFFLTNLRWTAGYTMMIMYHLHLRSIDPQLELETTSEGLQGTQWFQATSDLPTVSLTCVSHCFASLQLTTVAGLKKG